MIGAQLKAEIEHTFQIAKTRCTTNELVFVCPECGDTTGNRSVNLTTGATFCWRCNKGKHNKGHFLAWAKANGYNFTNSSNFSSVSIEEIFTDPQASKSRVPCVREVKLPRGFVYLREEPDCGYAKLIRKMALRKRLTLEDFIEAEAGFTRSDRLWEPFCIFPVKELSRIVYYQGRTYIDVPGETTKKFPSRAEVPNGASCWIYNYDEFYARQAPIAIVVESILNVLSLRKKLKELGVKDAVPVCVFKHSISPTQATKFFQCKWLKEICVMFDHDAVDLTWKQAESIGNITRLTIAEMPAGKDNKKLDPNDDVEAAIRAYDSRKPFTLGTMRSRDYEEPPVNRNLSSVRLEQHIRRPV